MNASILAQLLLKTSNKEVYAYDADSDSIVPITGLLFDEHPHGSRLIIQTDDIE